MEGAMTGQELAEWMAYDSLNAKVAEMVRDGADPDAAVSMVWTYREGA